MASSSAGTALVTGASSGIGAAYADALARRGHDLILVARDPRRLNDAAARISRDTDPNVQVVDADLAMPLGVATIVDVIEHDRSLTVLVNSAGVGSSASTLSADPALIMQMMDVNVVALTLLSHAAARTFASRSGGTIVQISALAGLEPKSMNGVFSTLKSYVLSLAEALRSDLKTKGVTIQVLLPGVVQTSFWDKINGAEESSTVPCAAGERRAGL